MNDVFITKILIVGACAFLAACANGAGRSTAAAPRAGSAGDPAPKLVAVDAKPAVKDPKSEVVCRREVVTGSFLPVRHCYTRAQLDQMRKDGQRLLRDRVRTDAGSSSSEGKAQ
jgi:hypothetical protein